MTAALIAQLEALIDKVTPGPWLIVHDEDGEPFIEADYRPDPLTRYKVSVAYEMRDKDMAWIALLSPANLRTLLDALRTATARAEALERENERLREALKPFAEVADAIFHKFDDGAIANAGKADDRAVWGFNNAEVTYGDFRRARQALEAK